MLCTITTVQAVVIGRLNGSSFDLARFNYRPSEHLGIFILVFVMLYIIYIFNFLLHSLPFTDLRLVGLDVDLALILLDLTIDLPSTLASLF